MRLVVHGMIHGRPVEVVWSDGNLTGDVEVVLEVMAFVAREEVVSAPAWGTEHLCRLDVLIDAVVTLDVVLDVITDMELQLPGQEATADVRMASGSPGLVAAWRTSPGTSTRGAP